MPSGSPPDRVIYAEAGKTRIASMVTKEGLLHERLAAMVGEVFDRMTLIAPRRLKLAAE